jgi:hypothetical protein
LKKSIQNIRDSGEMLGKDRYKTTSGFFVFPLYSTVSYERRKIIVKEEMNSAHEGQ